MAKKSQHQRDFEALDEKFVRLGVDTGQFGFYDQPAFLAEEQRDPFIVAEYARWVLERPRDKKYDDHVRTVVPKLAAILAAAFKADSIEGGCVGATSMITPMLNRLGVWSFGLKGAALLEVRKRNIVRGLFIADQRAFPNAELGHSWAVAPPFSIIDATLASQRWGDQTVSEFVPEFLTVEDGTRVITPTVADFVSPYVLSVHKAQEGRIDPTLHQRYYPELSTINKVFPALETEIGDLRVKYCPLGVQIADAPLEGIMSSGFRRSAIDIWNQEVEPAFRS